MSKSGRDRDFDSETQQDEQSGRDQKSSEGGHREKEDQGKSEQTVKHELPKDFGVSDSHKAPPRKQ
jgi:hypothetical protein